MKLRIKLCPDCYAKIERAPLLHVRRIMNACPKCRPAAVQLNAPQYKRVVHLSALAEAAKQAGEAYDPNSPATPFAPYERGRSPAADDLLDYLTSRKRRRGR